MDVRSVAAGLGGEFPGHSQPFFETCLPVFPSEAGSLSMSILFVEKMDILGFK